MTLNCRSIRQKTADLKVLIIDNKINVVILQETWLSPGETSVYAEFKELGFKICRMERKDKKGGGLATFIKSKISNKVSSIYKYKFDSFDNIVTLFNIQKHKFVVVNIYRPPSSSKSQFLIDFDNFLSQVLEIEGVLIISGDFNVDLLQKNNITDKFLEILYLNGLSQLRTTPTREMALLDLMIISSSFLNQFLLFFPTTNFPSDHIPLFSKFTITSTSRPEPTKKLVRDYSSLNWDSIRNDIKTSELANYGTLDNNLTSDECIKIYNTNISSIINSNCPVNTRTFRHDKSKRWFDSNLQKLKQNKRKCERQLRKLPGNRTYLDKYKTARNKYTIAIKEARINFFSNKISAFKGDSKNLFSTLNELTGNRKDAVFPSNKSNHVIAEDMSKFYVEKVENIRHKIVSDSRSHANTTNTASFSVTALNSNCNECFSSFKLLSISDVKDLVTSAKKKFSFLDPVPISLITEFIDLLYPLILQIINSSISSGIFPELLKHAVISPILKKHTLDPEIFQHYRPVSSLPFLSKVLESNLFNQINTYLEQNRLYSFYQSAYRKNHSCETSLFKLITDIQAFHSQGDSTVLILLDQSAAFDTIDHGILINKLQLHFGITGNALKLLKSYLENRSFSVKVDNCLSSAKKLRFGVPQGSLLGPLFYILYVCELEQIVTKHGFHVLVYADDCQLYAPFNDSNVDVLKVKLESCLKELKQWMTNNYLMLNKDKTLIKVFWNKVPRFSRLLDFDLTDSVKVLGVQLDSILNFNSFIAKKVATCNMHLRNLNNIKQSLNVSTRILLISNLILSTLDYCNVLLLSCNDKQLKPLRLIINRSIRFIYDLRFRTHITPYYHKLHFLPIKKRIRFKANLLAYKIFYRKAPLYLEEKVERFTPTIQHMQLREGAGRDKYMFEDNDPKSKTLVDLMKREWYKLPLNIRKITSISLFKKKLKSWLLLEV